MTVLFCLLALFLMGMLACALVYRLAPSVPFFNEVEAFFVFHNEWKTMRFCKKHVNDFKKVKHNALKIDVLTYDNCMIFKIDNEHCLLMDDTGKHATLCHYHFISVKKAFESKLAKLESLEQAMHKIDTKLEELNKCQADTSTDFYSMTEEFDTMVIDSSVAPKHKKKKRHGKHRKNIQGN